MACYDICYGDAEPYNQGYLGAAQICREALAMQGRGSTVLQPAIDFLEQAEDFPSTGLNLVITDGECDSIDPGKRTRFLLPESHQLPFRPKGPVFWIH